MSDMSTIRKDRENVLSEHQALTEAILTRKARKQTHMKEWQLNCSLLDETKLMRSKQKVSEALTK